MARKAVAMAKGARCAGVGEGERSRAGRRRRSERGGVGVGVRVAGVCVCGVVPRVRLSVVGQKKRVVLGRRVRAMRKKETKRASTAVQYTRRVKCFPMRSAKASSGVLCGNAYPARCSRAR